MSKYSLLNVSERGNGLVSGVWLQDFTGTKDEAFKHARGTEKANGNRIEVAVVERIEGSTASYNYLTDVKEVVSDK
jgi:hypothetical protein